MTTTSRITAPLAFRATPGAPDEWGAAFLTATVAAQRLQVELLLAWQQTIATFQQELWDEWVCRWAGGAPIDA